MDSLSIGAGIAELMGRCKCGLFLSHLIGLPDRTGQSDPPKGGSPVRPGSECGATAGRTGHKPDSSGLSGFLGASLSLVSTVQIVVPFVDFNRILKAHQTVFNDDLAFFQ